MDIDKSIGGCKVWDKCHSWDRNMQQRTPNPVSGAEECFTEEVNMRRQDGQVGVGGWEGGQVAGRENTWGSQLELGDIGMFLNF